GRAAGQPVQPSRGNWRGHAAARSMKTVPPCAGTLRSVDNFAGKPVSRWGCRLNLVQGEDSATQSPQHAPTLILSSLGRRVSTSRRLEKSPLLANRNRESPNEVRRNHKVICEPDRTISVAAECRFGRALRRPSSSPLLDGAGALATGARSLILVATDAHKN